jgi:uncharacterized protein YllA (UPF0747 family)
MQDTISGSIIQITRDAFQSEQTPRVFTQIMKKAIHTIKEIWKVHIYDLLVLHQNPNQLKKITTQIT